MPVVFTSHIKKVFHIKNFVSSFSVFFVAAIICYYSSQIFAIWENYYTLLIVVVELLFYCVEFLIKGLDLTLLVED